MKELIEQRDPRTLRHNHDNPRGEIVETPALLELAESIREKGVLQPILITPDDVIIFGHRRTVASIIAGLGTVPVMVDDGQRTRDDQIELMLIENAQREGLTTLQTARVYEVLVDRGLYVADIARAVGFNHQTISNYLEILKLPDEVHGYFENNQLAIGCAKELMRLQRPQTRIRFAIEAAQSGWTVKKLAERVEQHLKPRTPATEQRVQEQVEINAILNGLEKMDSILEKYPRFKEVQTLIGQAYRRLDALKAGKAPLAQPSRTAAPPPPPSHKEERSFTSVVATVGGMRKGKP